MKNWCLIQTSSPSNQNIVKEWLKTRFMNLGIEYLIFVIHTLKIICVMRIATAYILFYIQILLRKHLFPFLTLLPHLSRDP